MKRILISLAFSFLLFTVPIFAAETRGVKRVEIKTQAGELVGPYEQSHALVIGVSNYITGWPRLWGVSSTSSTDLLIVCVRWPRVCASSLRTAGGEAGQLFGKTSHLLPKGNHALDKN